LPTGAHTKAPATWTQSTSTPQQSARAAHGAPYGRHSDLHAKPPFGPGTQRPVQHWLVSAQTMPSERQAGVPAAWQRLGPFGLGSGRHFDMPEAAQQSGSLSQTSPGLPHADAGWQRLTPSLPTPHAPEQQSAEVAHSSHSLRQPPDAAQRLVPSLVATQTREQHWFASVQTSPTCAEHARLSFEVHIASEVQRSTPVASALQRCEQQSTAVVHVSPSGRQSWIRAQVRTESPRSTQMRPQHVMSPVHASPAGLQPAAALVQTPPAQCCEQQS
jgi:hypothetical protein